MAEDLPWKYRELVSEIEGFANLIRVTHDHLVACTIGYAMCWTVWEQADFEGGMRHLNRALWYLDQALWLQEGYFGRPCPTIICIPVFGPHGLFWQSTERVPEVIRTLPWPPGEDDPARQVIPLVLPDRLEGWSPSVFPPSFMRQELWGMDGALLVPKNVYRRLVSDDPDVREQGEIDLITWWARGLDDEEPQA